MVTCLAELIHRKKIHRLISGKKIKFFRCLKSMYWSKKRVKSTLLKDCREWCQEILLALHSKYIWNSTTTHHFHCYPNSPGELLHSLSTFSYATFSLPSTQPPDNHSQAQVRSCYSSVQKPSMAAIFLRVKAKILTLDFGLYTICLLATSLTTFLTPFPVCFASSHPGFSVVAVLWTHQTCSHSRVFIWSDASARNAVPSDAHTALSCRFGLCSNTAFPIRPILTTLFKIANYFFLALLISLTLINLFHSTHYLLTFA